MASVRGAERIQRRLERLRGPEMVRRLSQALFAGGEAVQVEAQLSITRDAVSGKNHVPSAPGQPPNNDTGVLAGNIETVAVRPLLVRVKSKAPYASALEFGTSKMAARPYMKPALQKKKDAVTAAVRRAFKVT